MWTLLALSLLSHQAAPLEDPQYTSALACVASLRAAREAAPEDQRGFIDGSINILDAYLARVDEERGDNPRWREEAIQGIYQAQVAADAWQDNVQRCHNLAFELGG